MDIFLTGATGLLGINTVHAALRRGHTIHALVRSVEKARRVLPANEARVKIIVGDIKEPNAWLPQLENATALIHTAAFFREYFGPGDHAATLEALNVQLPLLLARAADTYGLQKSIMVSSSGVVFARPDGSPAEEADAPRTPVPENQYFVSKVTMENTLRGLPLNHPLIIVRPGWMFGPNDYAPTGAGQLVQQLLATGSAQLVDGSPLEIADARDIAEGMVLALEKTEKDTVYNLAGNAQTALNALRKIAACIPRARVQQVPLPLALALSTVLEPISRLRGQANPLPKAGLLTVHRGVLISSEKAKRELGVTFRPFEETARDTVEFFRGRYAA